METEDCEVCREPLSDDDPAVLVRFWEWRKSPRHVWHPGQSSAGKRMCQGCAAATRSDTDENTPDALVRASNPVSPVGMARGRCEACGLAVLYPPDARRKHVYCSNGCRIALTPTGRARSVREAVTHECEVCSLDYTPTRSDSRYCSNACRQKAARLRAGPQ